MKILGIGLGRTGTRSLYSALKILGYKAKHCPGFFLDSNGRLKIEEALFDNYDAATDEPCILIYKEIDKKYPGTKFILTIRDKKSWLKSIENNSTAMKDVWLKNPAVPLLHYELYGTDSFDAERFSLAYDQHVKNVHEYFKGRKNDLLILNVCAGEGWEKLCPFLEKEIPNVPFPKENVFGVSDFSTIIKKEVRQTNAPDV